MTRKVVIYETSVCTWCASAREKSSLISLDMVYRRLIVWVILIAMFIGLAAGAVTIGAESWVERDVASWDFDEGSGNVVYDKANNGNDGIVHGATWTSDSFSGFALEFDGIDDKVVIKKTPSVDLINSVILEVYVKRKSHADGTIIAKNGPYYLGIKDNRVVGGVYTNDGNCPESCVTPGANTWTHVEGRTILEPNVWYKLKMEYDGRSLSVLVGNLGDSVLLGNSVRKIGQMPQVSQQVFIGWGEPGLNQFFDGIIDKVEIRTIERKFIRGDANRDGEVDISDSIRILLYLFRGLKLRCKDAADVNDDGKIDISDPQYLLRSLFKGGLSPPAPYPGVGSDSTVDDLMCEG